MTAPQVPDDPFVRTVVRIAVHLRRHLPLYAIAAGVLLVAAIVPTVVTQSGGTSAGGGTGTVGAGQSPAANGQGAAGSGALGANASGSAGAGGVGGSAGGGVGGAGSAASVAQALATQPLGKLNVGTGTTRGGFACAPGVHQIPWSEYAPPCQGVYSGGNGGATSRGVTATQIVLADREYQCNANCQAVQQFAAQAGAAPASVEDPIDKVFIDYFNKTFELYGRQVVIKPYQTNADSTQEALGQGKAQACADADAIANQMHAYGEDGWGFGGGGAPGSGPFSECAAQYGLVEFAGGAYYDEQWYRSLDPFVWNTTMECQRISHMVAEVGAKQLMNKTAKWAGDPVTRAKTRLFGTYVPNNPPYQRCVKIAQDDLKNKYHDNPGYTFNYVLDVSRFADQASQAIVQFHSEGVTSVVLACDPISPVFLTQSAKSQGYFPEWIIIGTALNDVDTVPRLWDATEVTGHLFGLSQLGPTSNLAGPNSEAGITYKKITGKDLPQGAGLRYLPILQVFSFLQAAGPILTPRNMANGVEHLPPGGAAVPGGTRAYAAGYACFCTNPDGTPGITHTAVEDSRLVYWDGDGTSPYDGKRGTYVEMYGGSRFRLGQFPTGDPPVYPPNDPQ
ncbi:MAG TPA: hypothetical protein VFA11_14980 [Acidimicrobiales bacterium]|nr:hypothetical protein [Acidimicrobiales bacterium]